MPDSGEGASRTGGRFNPVGIPALYTSVRFETAWLEAQQGFAFKAQPLTLCAYEVDCEDVLDFTNPLAMADQNVQAADLACPWKDLATRAIKPPTWLLAERLIKAGIAGVVVPSFASGATAADINVVFWKWHKMPPHQVRVVDDEGRLPMDARSWS